MSIRHLDSLLAPRSIAVIGASNRSGSVGATVWQNLSAGRFEGPLYAVNPARSTLDGEPCYKRVSALPAPPDLAVICTPPATVAELIRQLGALGCHAAIVMTAGMSAAQKQAMLDAARPTLLRVLGPNCLGMLAPHLGVNASFAHVQALPGQVAFVSQSGALVTAVLDWASARKIGFSHMVSLGEHADVDFGDLLDYLASDPLTRSILLYIESIESSCKFMSAARAAARNKPVILVKAGRAGHGMAAAASHTGALAGSDMVFDAAIRRAGMLRVDTLQDLFMAAETLARFGANRDQLLTVMTNGGGAGVMAADAAALAGITLAELDAPLLARLDTMLPATWSRANPIDIIGDAPVARYSQTLQALLADRDTGAVLFIHAPTAIVGSAEIAEACAPIVRSATDRVLGCWLGDASVARARQIFEEAGAANYETPEQAVRAFALLSTYRRNQALLLETPTADENGPPDLPSARSMVAAALADGREMLHDHEATAILKAYGIPIVESADCGPTPAAAVESAAAIGYPVALKIRSPDISHKSDVGGVALALRDAAQLGNAVEQMLQRVRAARPQARIDGFTIQAMASRPFAQELIVGTSIDPVFGPVILFGQGGTAVEVIADRAIALPPLNRVVAKELISRTRVAKLLAGYRDHPPARLDAIADVLIGLSQMLTDLPELAELDINPLLADADGVIALDARIRVDRAGPGGATRFSIMPYPAELVETVDWHGSEIVLRPIRPEDGPQHRSFAGQLGAEDLRLRFFSARRELPHSELARLTQIDYSREMAFIAVRSVAGAADETLGVVRAVIDPDNVEAEFAAIIRSDLKAQGLGGRLMDKLIDYLRRRGTQRVVGHILRDNDSMRRLVRSLGFVMKEQDPHDDASVWVLQLN